MCEVTFTKWLCVIHDLTTRSPIGVGEPKRGVYYFKKSATETAQANKVISYETWHSRLGHPSHQALSYITRNIRGRDRNDLCDVYICAKQTRKPFTVSENKALNCFDLIHYDIWGSYHEKALCGAIFYRL